MSARPTFQKKPNKNTVFFPRAIRMAGSCSGSFWSEPGNHGLRDGYRSERRIQYPTRTAGLWEFRWRPQKESAPRSNLVMTEAFSADFSQEIESDAPFFQAGEPRGGGAENPDGPFIFFSYFPNRHPDNPKKKRPKAFKHHHDLTYYIIIPRGAVDQRNRRFPKIRVRPYNHISPSEVNGRDTHHAAEGSFHAS